MSGKLRKTADGMGIHKHASTMGSVRREETNRHNAEVYISEHPLRVAVKEKQVRTQSGRKYWGIA